jgi:hypothetical protein
MANACCPVALRRDSNSSAFCDKRKCTGIIWLARRIQNQEVQIFFWHRNQDSELDTEKSQVIPLLLSTDVIG